MGDPDDPSIVLVNEISELDAAEDVAAAVCRSVSETCGHTVRLILIPARTIPKTSSGKVQHSSCRAMYLANELPIVWSSDEASPTPESGGVDGNFGTESLSQPGVLERQLVDWLQRELSLSNLTWQTPLTELGIDSLKGVELVNVLSTAFDHTFPATSMLDHPTVASLAGLIRAAKRGTDTGGQGRASGDAYTAEQIDALDERELARVLQRRIHDVLGGGRP